MSAFRQPLTATRQHVERLVASHRRWIVLAMLLALHAALVSETVGAFTRVWLLVHFGLFLLWQPFFSRERAVDRFAAVLIVVITAATLYFLSGWILVTWLLVLLGILGGRVFTLEAGRRNFFYLVAFAYVLALLLLWCVPRLLLAEVIPDAVDVFARAVLPWILIALAVLPVDTDAEDGGAVFDFFYAVMVFQLGVVLVLGAIALMRFTGARYFASVALTASGFGVALFVFAVLWNPVRGFGGLRTYFSRYLLSVGTPFELWMRRIAGLAEGETDPRRFLELAVAEVAGLPWVCGGRWRVGEEHGTFGRPEGHAMRFEQHGLELTFHTTVPLSPALLLHMRLLAQVIGEFHEGKRREAALRRNAYLQAVHETGARLTHDVKNLLQSIYTLTSMAPREPAEGYGALLQRQLPQLSKRLQTTLDKLRSPEVAVTERMESAAAWWSALEPRLAGTGVNIKAAIDGDALIPASLFDSFVENALENARAKAARETEVAIEVELVVSAAGVTLSVSDTGSAVPDAIAARLLREPIERGDGLGLGLYHVARQAGAAGCVLTLAENRAGRVSFSLASIERR